MRFRSIPTGQILTWTLLAVFWIAMLADNLHRDLARHRSGEEQLHTLALAFWVVLFLFYVYMYLFSRLDLESTSLRIRSVFRSTRIPYDEIVAIHPVRTSKGKLLPHQLELETARLSPAIYPHGSRRVAVADPSAFIHALQDKAPQAEYEAA